MKSAKLTRLMISIVALALGPAGGSAAAGAAYPDPAGGWAYIYAGDAAVAGPSGNYDSLDGTWSHNNGSDAWDGSAIGAGRPGGVSALNDGGVGFVRLQDTGDPRDYGMGDPSNRKLMFGHSITDDLGPVAETILDEGITICFRARISTGSPLDDAYSDGGGGSSPWPAGGDGYVIHDGGKSNFSVRQSAGGKLISFALALASDVGGLSVNGLIMNKLNGNRVTGDVDFQGGEPGMVNILPIDDITAWHEFWITIQLDGTGTGTHVATIWMDGSLSEQRFYVTAGSGSDFGDSYLALGLGATPQSGAIDVDSFAYTAGVIAPKGGNLPPLANAGLDREIMLPVDSVKLDGTVEDDGIGEPNGYLAIEWSKVTGPGMVTFAPNASIEDPTATFSEPGEYVLVLAVADGLLNDSDTVTITVTEPNCPVGDLNGDCKVGFRDVSILVDQWLSLPDCVGFGCPDLDGANGVDGGDYALLAQSWLASWLGSLQVVITPSEAVDAGAQWRVDGGAWRNSGDRVADLFTGLHQVEFKVVSDWILPESQAVHIARNQAALVVVTYYKQPPSKVVISEFMANKGSELATTVQRKEVRPDWIEIHNGTDVAVNLQGWHLTDNEDQLTKWRFPNLLVNPGQYVVVLASEKERKYYPDNYPYNDGRYYHTNFELDREGEYLALVKPDGVTVAHEYAPRYPQQRGFVSYGECDSGKYGYFTNPTPGSANSASCVNDIVAEPRFSKDRGFYDAPFYAAITSNTDGATIRYTTDGSTPGEQHGQIYSDPVLIERTTCLRAVALKPDWLASTVTTQTYIFLDDIIHQTGEGFPNTWGHAGADYEMDPLIAGGRTGTIKDDLKSVPTVSLVMSIDDWFNRSSNMDVGGIYAHPDWEDSEDPRAERSVSAEFFDPDPCGLGRFQIDAVVRIAGGSSTSGWKSDKLSMRLKFREPYGPTKLDYPLFGEDAAERFDTLVLDARLNNAWNYGRNDTQRRRAQYARDQYTSDLQNAMGGYGHHGQHVHLYLNGLYWGLYNLHERPDDSFAASYFGGNKKDYDVLKHTEHNVVNGSNADYLRMCDLAESGLSTNSKYELMQQYLDVPNFIDYMIANFYYGNTDWAGHNWYASRSQFDPEGRWRFHSWDAEKGMHGTGDDVTSKDDGYGSPTHLHRKLASNAEYRLLFADRVHSHFFNDGVLTVENATALYQHRLDVVDRAVVGESARWGDNRIDQGGIRYTRDNHWVVERDRLLASYFPERTDRVLGQIRSRGLYPNIAAPRFSPHGGWDSTGLTLVMDNPNGFGTIYYSTDDGDPREYGTGSAIGTPYGGAVSITESCRVKARVLSGSTWSALNEATFAVGPVAENLRITELMYRPRYTGDPNDPNTEFIELKNIGAETIKLNLVKFTNGIEFTFGSTELSPDKYVLVVKDVAAFAAKYGLGYNIAGQYTGSLNNNGERVELLDAAGRTIHNFRYRDGWYDITDGLGFSLTVREPASTDPKLWDDKSTWRPSASVDGSPGTDDAGLIPELGDVVINEILSHSHAEASDWIELHNTTDYTINIGGWFLSDDADNLMKYEIAEGTTVTAGGYVVFAEELHFGNWSDPGAHVPFALSENGETLYLHSGRDGELTGYSEQEKFGASETGVSFGRYQKSTGTYNFVAMSINTPGTANAYPKVGPVVLSEIMYHPDSPADAEYVELLNISDMDVTLYDFVTSEPWRFTDDPDNPGIEFLYPSDPPVTVASGEYILMVKNLATFSSKYTAPEGTQIFAWGAGRLDNGGEKVQISLPGDIDAEGVRQYIRVDRVRYSDGSHPDDFTSGADPWPTGADGFGSSLSRLFGQHYGNDPNNWQAATPSPGKVNPR
ncbi:MAG: lamin tail domain-containing protein [Phycisphaerales bacterium]|nr:MAG: lamin tail domain-containing protein [Phycisphaerales bacterium]